LALFVFVDHGQFLETFLMCGKEWRLLVLLVLGLFVAVSGTGFVAETPLVS